jgi:3,4-dihydroxy 2-butanone 4-phosphate synthase/GTP cyclohydrolase II
MPTCTSALPVDAREYGTAAKVLLELGVQRLRLITNNPAKCDDLAAYGIEIAERVALPTRRTPENITYLETKRRRMGHLLGDLETSVG